MTKRKRTKYVEYDHPGLTKAMERDRLWFELLHPESEQYIRPYIEGELSPHVLSQMQFKPTHIIVAQAQPGARMRNFIYQPGGPDVPVDLTGVAIFSPDPDEDDWRRDLFERLKRIKQ